MDDETKELLKDGLAALLEIVRPVAIFVALGFGALLLAILMRVLAYWSGY